MAGFWQYIFLLALIIGELLALMGVMGIVADLVQEGIRLLFNEAHISRFWIITILSIAMYFLVVVWSV